MALDKCTMAALHMDFQKYYISSNLEAKQLYGKQKTISKMHMKGLNKVDSWKLKKRCLPLIMNKLCSKAMTED